MEYFCLKNFDNHHIELGKKKKIIIKQIINYKILRSIEYKLVILNIKFFSFIF